MKHLSFTIFILVSLCNLTFAQSEQNNSIESYLSKYRENIGFEVNPGKHFKKMDVDYAYWSANKSGSVVAAAEIFGEMFISEKEGIIFGISLNRNLSPERKDYNYMPIFISNTSDEGINAENYVVVLDDKAITRKARASSISYYFIPDNYHAGIIEHSPSSTFDDVDYNEYPFNVAIIISSEIEADITVFAFFSKEAYSNVEKSVISIARTISYKK